MGGNPVGYGIITRINSTGVKKSPQNGLKIGKNAFF
jgi:hypothetical protein